MANRILIAGASGLVGFAALKHFSGLPDWDVLALSRRLAGARVDGRVEPRTKSAALIVTAEQRIVKLFLPTYAI
jgi:uncharacterized protein YbjT (DUF2867 family)